MNKICDLSTWKSLEDSKVRCHLCPNLCEIKEGNNGKCRVRKNISGELNLINYSQLVCCKIDHLKNRPIYLWGNGGTKSLTLGLTGCNNTCPFCQNYMVSQVKKYYNEFKMTPEEVVNKALLNNVDFISFTFTEPIVWFEYFEDVAKKAKEKNIKVCVKTAGYISEDFQHDFLFHVDAINIDIKPLNDNYLNKCGIPPEKAYVVDSLLKRAIKKGVHTEVSHIVIEGINDNESSIINLYKKIINSGGKDIGIHLLRHYPSFKSDAPVTTDKTLDFCKEVLIKCGAKNVFTNDVQ